MISVDTDRVQRQKKQNDSKFQMDLTVPIALKHATDFQKIVQSLKQNASEAQTEKKESKPALMSSTLDVKSESSHFPPLKVKPIKEQTLGISARKSSVQPRDTQKMWEPRRNSLIPHKKELSPIQQSVQVQSESADSDHNLASSHRHFKPIFNCAPDLKTIKQVQMIQNPNMVDPNELYQTHKSLQGQVKPLPVQKLNYLASSMRIIEQQLQKSNVGVKKSRPTSARNSSGEGSPVLSRSSSQKKASKPDLKHIQSQIKSLFNQGKKSFKSEAHISNSSIENQPLHRISSFANQQQQLQQIFSRNAQFNTYNHGTQSSLLKQNKLGLTQNTKNINSLENQFDSIMQQIKQRRNKIKQTIKDNQSIKDEIKEQQQTQMQLQSKSQQVLQSADMLKQYSSPFLRSESIQINQDQISQSRVHNLYQETLCPEAVKDQSIAKFSLQNFQDINKQKIAKTQTLLHDNEHMRGVIQTYRKMIEEVISNQKKQLQDEDEGRNNDNYTEQLGSETMSYTVKEGGHKLVSKQASDAGDQVIPGKNHLKSTFQVVDIVQEIPLDHQEAHVTELTAAQLAKIGDVAKLNNNDVNDDNSDGKSSTPTNQVYTRLAKKTTLKTLNNIHNVDLTKMSQFTNSFNRIFKEENRYELVQMLNEELISLFGLSQCSFIPLSYNQKSMMLRGQAKSYSKMFNKISFTDQNTAVQTSYVAFSNTPEQCVQRILFQSLVRPLERDPNQTVDQPEGPLRLITGSRDSIVIGMTTHQISVLVRSHEGANLFIIQVALAQTKKKRHFSQSDALLLKLISMCVLERLYKFLWQAQSSNKKSEIIDVLNSIKIINNSNSFKSLCKNIQNELPTILPFQDCLCLFKDGTSQQFYNIAFSADNDKQAGYIVEIKKKEDAIKKLVDKKSSEVLSKEKIALDCLVKECQLDMDSRNIVLQMDQMICIPANLGISGVVAKEKRAIYLNNFDKGNKPIEFSAQSDNLKAIKDIKSILMGPMIDQNHVVNGIIQLYNCNQGQITNSMVKKIKAFAKFLGAMHYKQEIQGEKLLVKVGLLEKRSELSEFFSKREQINKNFADNLKLVKLDLFKENVDSYYSKYEQFGYFGQN